MMTSLQSDLQWKHLNFTHFCLCKFCTEPNTAASLHWHTTDIGWQFHESRSACNEKWISLHWYWAAFDLAIRRSRSRWNSGRWVALKISQPMGRQNSAIQIVQVTKSNGRFVWQKKKQMCHLGRFSLSQKAPNPAARPANCRQTEIKPHNVTYPTLMPIPELRSVTKLFAIVVTIGSIIWKAKCHSWRKTQVSFHQAQSTPTLENWGF